MRAEEEDIHNDINCQRDYQAERLQMTLAIRDTLDILDGKWKIVILGTLSFTGKKRFMELQREIEGIGAKMLSKELQELEANRLVKRTVCDTKPITVEYEITPYGKTLDKLILEIVKWGGEHRRSTFAENY